MSDFTFARTLYDADKINVNNYEQTHKQLVAGMINDTKDSFDFRNYYDKETPEQPYNKLPDIYKAMWNIRMAFPDKFYERFNGGTLCNIVDLCGHTDRIKPSKNKGEHVYDVDFKGDHNFGQICHIVSINVTTHTDKEILECFVNNVCGKNWWLSDVKNGRTELSYVDFCKNIVETRKLSDIIRWAKSYDSNYAIININLPELFKDEHMVIVCDTKGFKNHF